MTSISSALPLIAGALAAGGMFVVASNDALRSLPKVASWVTSTLRPLRRAGDEGYAPTEIERRRLVLLVTGATLLATVLLSGFGPLMLLAAVGPSVSFYMIKHRRSRYLLQVEMAIPEVSAALGDALAGGTSLQRALCEAGGSLHGPSAKEFARVRVDIEMGVAARESLEGLAQRLRSERIDALVSLLLSGSASGGDLVLLLRRFGDAEMSRRLALKDANSATAQARYTGMLVVALPAGAALFAELVRPGFFSGILADPASTLLLVLACLLQAIGLFIVRRLGKLVGS